MGAIERSVKGVSWRGRVVGWAERAKPNSPTGSAVKDLLGFVPQPNLRKRPTLSSAPGVDSMTCFDDLSGKVVVFGSERVTGLFGLRHCQAPVVVPVVHWTLAIDPGR